MTDMTSVLAPPPLAELLIAEAERLYELDIMADSTGDGSRARDCIINVLTAGGWTQQRIVRRLGVDRATVRAAGDRQSHLLASDPHFRAVSSRLMMLARKWHERMERDD